MNCICVLPRVLSVGVFCRMEVPVSRWIVTLVTLLTWFGGMGLALTPDGLALLEFREGLTAASPLVESWNASDPSPCSWGGITCTDRGEVLNITLINQVPKLEGQLSASLGKLKSLEGLWLDSNLLSGSIPPEIGNLSSLRNLSLSFQSFSGEIPPQLSNCRNLVQLRLNSNNFTGDITTVLEELSNLPAIQQIALDNNSFAGTLPPAIGNATTLTFLSLGQSWNLGQRGGGFGGQIPKELGKLVNLKTLWLGDINFTGGIPPELQSMSSLSDLDLGQINLSGEIPPWLANMTSLNILALWGNEISGTIPSFLENLTGLTDLLLANNNLSGTIPSFLGNLTSLTSLQLNTNNLTGTIPSTLGNLTNLIDFRSYDNDLSGSIPSSLGNLVNLTGLHLGNNSLTGPIPFRLTSLTNLIGVQLYLNNLTGPIPEDFGRFMANLTYFEIAYNSINGTLPDGLCEGGKLQWITTTHNNLGGPIPTSLASCKTLVQARFAYNQFISIPTDFGSNSSLFYLDVSYNQLEGPLPSGLGTNSSLAFLRLNANKLTGNISILEFSQLVNLTILNLANNNFTGEIPAAMGFCNLLSQVDLSYNSFTGAVPSELTNLSNLQELYLQGNNLTEFHPGIYAGLAGTLRTLNLAENPWNAPIETEIASLKVLQSLNLSYGGRTGPIPSALEELTLLEVLDLSHNNLTGEIPSTLGELMTSLVSVNVSFNNLTGTLPPAWVKFLNADPALFHGNPGLCLRYNSENMCISSSSVRTGGKLKVSVKVIVAIVLVVFGVSVVLVVFVALRCCKRKPKVEEMPREEITTMNLTNEPLPLTFEQILSATDNLSDLHIIGKGGHGTVYKVKCPSDTCSYIAVKKIEFESDVMPTMLHKSFWSEVKSVGQARHRNLVRLLGFIKRDKVGLLVYDYISNGDLHSALHNRKADSEIQLTWKARLCIARDVAHGLAYLHHDHDAPIVHRDIKSSNVLLNDDMEAYISDFGLAKVLGTQLESKAFLSSANMNVLGTYGYIAPEIGYGRVATSKVDVYSYGVLLLELVTGKLPTHDSSYGEALHVVEWVNQKVQLNQGKVSKSVLDPLFLNPLDSIATDVMLSLQEIALLCTRENPADRPSMRDVENMLNTLFEMTNTGSLYHFPRGVK